MNTIEPAYAAAMPAPQGGALPTGLEWQALTHMAHTLANSSVIPYRLKNKPDDVAVILLAAREYGIPPLMALSKLPVVNGTPAPMGELMVALVLRAGHRISAVFRNPDGSPYTGGPLSREHYGEAVYSRRDWDDSESLRFTIAEAVQAGLVSVTSDGKPMARDQKGNPTPWEQYTPNMARWRAVSNACRLAFADVLMGLSYLPEELGAVVDADGSPITAEVISEGPRVRTAPPASIEAREAQDTADRLVDFPGPVEVLDNVLAHARNNGFDGELVRVEWSSDPVTLVAAIEATKVRISSVVPEAPEEPVDAVLVDEQPQVAPEATAEAESPQRAALDIAGLVLGASDLTYLGTLYRDNGDLLAEDVVAALTETDAATLGAPPGLTALALGTLVMQVKVYIEKHGVAVRPSHDATVPDPWAADAPV